MNITRIVQLAGALVLAFLLAGCATTGQNSQDPYEGYNRAVFKFNDTLDQAALKPAAKAYRAVLPSFVQTGIGNFFGNLDDIWTVANDVMQAKGERGANDFMRVAVNSTFGLAGILDVSSEAGLKKHSEDFGLTMARWGVQSGPYVMLPLLGPTTMRDALGMPLDFEGDPWTYVYPVYLRNTGSVVREVDKRANLLDGTDLIEDAALDRYEFIRDAYLQRRQSKVDNNKSDGDSSEKNTDENADKPKSPEENKSDNDAPMKGGLDGIVKPSKELSAPPPVPSGASGDVGNKGSNNSNNAPAAVPDKSDNAKPGDASKQDMPPPQASDPAKEP